MNFNGLKCLFSTNVSKEAITVKRAQSTLVKEATVNARQESAANDRRRKR